LETGYQTRFNAAILRGQRVLDDPQVEAGKLLRRFHDATAHSSLRGDAEVVVHEDFTQCNTVFVDGKPKAMIDFDNAKPGARRWDLAHAILLWLHLGNEEPEMDRGKQRSAFGLERQNINEQDCD
jgi:aminoglycoside phosphotransferase (APT) family kinase protein